MHIDINTSFGDIVEECLHRGYDLATAQSIALQVVQYRNQA